MGLKWEDSIEEPNKQIENDGELGSNSFSRKAVDMQFLAAPLEPVDKFQLLPEFLKVRGLVKQHLDSFNYFVRTGIKKIVRANDRITTSNCPDVYLRFKDIRIGQPSIMIDGSEEQLTPQRCRLSDITIMWGIRGWSCLAS